jgi:hypothetical protein
MQILSREEFEKERWELLESTRGYTKDEALADMKEMKRLFGGDYDSNEELVKIIDIEYDTYLYNAVRK